MNSWQLIFLQSKVNNGGYYGELLPPRKWDWPEETWFQNRYLRSENGRVADAMIDQDSRNIST